MNQLAQPVMMLGLVYVGRSIDWELNDRIFWLRIVYAVSVVLMAGALVYIRMKIDAWKEGQEKTIKIPVVASMSNPNPGKDDKEELTMAEYDMREWRTLLSGNCVTIGLLVLFHWKWEAVIPLFLQSIMSPQRLVESPLFQCYVLGKTFKRPFPKPEGLMEKLKKNMEDANRVAQDQQKKMK